MNNPLQAADALHDAVRGTKERQSPETLAALAAYERAKAEAEPAKTKHECLWSEDCSNPRFKDFDYCVDHLLQAHSQGYGDIKDSELKRIRKAAKPVAADWMRELAHDFARWFDNEGVGNCFDECLAIVKQHAPAQDSSQLHKVLETARIVIEVQFLELPSKSMGYLKHVIEFGLDLLAQDSRDSAITAQDLIGYMENKLGESNTCVNVIKRERAAMAAEAKEKS